MTQLFDQVIKEVSKLPTAEQDALASILLEEIASEARWTDSFAKSQELLDKLAAEALAEYAAGRPRPM